MNSINFKEILLINAKKIMKANVNKKFEKLSEASNDLNNNIIDALIEQNNSIITVKTDVLSMEEIAKEKNKIKKEQYHFPDVLNVGELINVKNTPSEIYKNNKFKSSIPFFIPTQKSGIAFLINNKFKEDITKNLETMVVNMMMSLPNGLVKLTLIDKTGSGQNFPILNRFNEKFIEGKVLTEDSEIEEELETIKNSMGNIAQAISANGFDSIEEYNTETNEVPQRYNFIVINDFPSGFNKKSTENIFALIESGYKSGMYVYLTSKFDHIYGYNQNINGMNLGSFLSLMTTFEYSNRNHIYITDKTITKNIEVSKCPIVEEAKFKAMVNNAFKIKFNQESEAYIREKVKFMNKDIQNISLRPLILLEKLIPDKSKWYSKTAEVGISVPYGKKGIEDTYFSLGINKDGEIENVHHGLVCGMTGSGKTVFIHDIIVMSSILYSPEELQFYLLDYKEGTEFAIYKDFPQVNILSMDSEIEFGHDVLQHALDIITERGKLFKEVRAQNLKSYNGSVEKEKRLPRIVIFIDEFQELFPKDQRISGRTNELIDNILRRGRSFGINIILATQTLMGIDLERSILQNMPLRIGLKMEEKDTVKVFGENNNAPKFLKYPGEGIYNNSHGMSKNNVAFQACNIDDHKIYDLLDELHTFMKDNVSEEFYNNLIESRFVYSGENPGNINNLKENESDKYYVGEPIGLETKHISLKFENDFGENLALIGGNNVQATSMIVYLLKQIQEKDTNAEIYMSNFSLHLEPLIEKEFEENVNDKFNVLKNDDFETNFDLVFAEYQRRKENKLRNENKIYFTYFIIENSKELNSGSTKRRKNIEELISSAPEYGIHTIFYALDFGTVRDLDLSRHLNKFRKKIVVKGGNSEKALSSDSVKKFSKNNQIAMIEIGTEEVVRFKPYIKESIDLYITGGIK